MIRHLAVLACLLSSAVLGAADGAWVAPVSWSDPEGKWVDIPLSWDNSTASYAADQSNRAGNGPWLELQFAAAIRTDRVLVNADFGFGIVDAVDLEARAADGSWTPLHHGAVANCANDIRSFPALTTDTIRFRFHYLTAGYYFWLYSVAAFALPPSVELPQVATGAATSVTASTAALHGTITSDGGEPCAYRFRYGVIGAAVWAETPWSGAAVSGQGGSSVLLPVTGLQNGTTYAYHIQARNSVGVATGTDVVFTPQPVALGSVEWLSASDVASVNVAGMSWDGAIHALDDDGSTAARCYHPLWATQWGPYLELSLPPVEIDHVQLNAGANPYIDAVAIELRTTADGAWAPLYQGAFQDRTWLVLPLPARATYAQARVRFHVTTTGVGTNWELYEFQVRMPPLVSFARGADMSVVPPGHVTIPLQVRPASSLPITLAWTVGGTAVRGTDWDFTGGGDTFTISAGMSAPLLGIDVNAMSATQSVSLQIAGVAAGRLSTPDTATVTLVPPVLAAPVITPPAGTYEAPVLVTITGPNGAILRFTDDGSDPTARSPVATDTLLISRSQTLAVRAFLAGWVTSPAAVVTYVLQAAPPVVSLPAGTYVGARSVTLTSTSPGAAIHYTLDGSEPTDASPEAVAAIALPGSCTLRAIALVPGWSPSTVVSFDYDLQVPAPVIAPAGGDYAVSVTVTASVSDAVASIQVSRDGGTAEVLPVGGITLATTTTVTMVAVRQGWLPSAAAVAIYTIHPVPVITSPLVASGTVGQAFSYQITATNAPTAFAATGLPDGLVCDGATGVISGTPTAAGSTSVSVVAANAAGDSAPAAVSFTIQSAAEPSLDISITPRAYVIQTSSAVSYRASTLIGTWSWLDVDAMAAMGYPVGSVGVGGATVYASSWYGGGFAAFGTVFGSVSISPAGWVGLNGGSLSGDPAPLSAGNATGAVIAPFWAHLGAGTVRYVQLSESELVVEWALPSLQPGGGALTAQLYLSSYASPLLMYRSVPAEAGVVGFAQSYANVYGTIASVVGAITADSTIQLVPAPLPAASARITRTVLLQEALTVGVQTSGSAVAGWDYEALPATVTLPVGTASIEVPIYVYGHAETGTAKILTAVLAPPAGGAYPQGARSADFTIYSADHQLQILGQPSLVLDAVRDDIGHLTLSFLDYVDPAQVALSVYGGTGQLSLSNVVNDGQGVLSATVAFRSSGAQTLHITLVNTQGQTAFASVTTTVPSRLTRVALNGPALLNSGASGQYTVLGYDQFDQLRIFADARTWQATGGTVSDQGLFTAGQDASAVISVSMAGLTASTTVTINRAPSITTCAVGSAAAPTDREVAATLWDDLASQNVAWTLTVLDGDASLLRLLTPAGTGTTVACRIICSGPGTWTLRLHVWDTNGLTADRDAILIMERDVVGLQVSPALVPGETAGPVQFTVRATDQFGVAMPDHGPVTWSLVGPGSLDAAGLLTRSTTGAGALVSATIDTAVDSAVVLPTPGGDSGSYVEEDPDPLASPQVRISISAGLTGDLTAIIKGTSWSLTNLQAVTCVIAARIPTGSSVESVVVESSLGVRNEFTHLGAVELTGLPEGAQQLTATVIVRNSTGAVASGASDGMCRLWVDITPPRPAYVRNVSQSTDAYGNVIAPYVDRPFRISDDDEDMILLNGMDEAYNRRYNSGLRQIFSRDAFTLDVLLEDATGLSATTSATAAIGSHTLSATPQFGAAQELPDRVVFTGFSALPDSIAYDEATLRHTTYIGKQKLTVGITDRAGNVTTDAAVNLWVKTAKPLARFGVIGLSGAWSDVAIRTDFSQLQMSPVGPFVAASDVVDVKSSVQGSYIPVVGKGTDAPFGVEHLQDDACLAVFLGGTDITPEEGEVTRDLTATDFAGNTVTWTSPPMRIVKVAISAPAPQFIDIPQQTYDLFRGGWRDVWHGSETVSGSLIVPTYFPVDPHVTEKLVSGRSIHWLIHTGYGAAPQPSMTRVSSYMGYWRPYGATVQEYHPYSLYDDVIKLGEVHSVRDWTDWDGFPHYVDYRLTFSPSRSWQVILQEFAAWPWPQRYLFEDMTARLDCPDNPSVTVEIPSQIRYKVTSYEQGEGELNAISASSSELPDTLVGLPPSWSDNVDPYVAKPVEFSKQGMYGGTQLTLTSPWLPNPVPVVQTYDNWEKSQPVELRIPRTIGRMTTTTRLQGTHEYNWRKRVTSTEGVRLQDSNETTTLNVDCLSVPWGLGGLNANMVSITPDVVAAGQYVEVRIRGLPSGITWWSKVVDSATEANVFLHQGYEPSTIPDAWEDKIVLVSAPTAYTDMPQGPIIPTKKARLRVGSRVKAKLYDVEFPGAHRMKEALMVINIAHETQSNQNVTQLKKSFSAPELTASVGSTSISDKHVTVSFSGSVQDTYAGLVQNSALKAVHVFRGSEHVGDISLQVANDGATDWAPYAKHFTFSGSVTSDAWVGTQTMVLLTDTNEMGAHGRVEVPVTLSGTQPVPELVAQVSIATGLGLSPTVADTITVTSPDVAAGGTAQAVVLTETGPDTREFTGPGEWLATIAAYADGKASCSVSVGGSLRYVGDFIVGGNGELTRTDAWVPAIAGPTTLAFGLTWDGAWASGGTLRLALPSAFGAAAPLVLAGSGGADGNGSWSSVFNGNNVVVTAKPASVGGGSLVTTMINGSMVSTMAVNGVSAAGSANASYTVSDPYEVASYSTESVGSAESANRAMGNAVWEPYRIRVDVPEALGDAFITGRTWTVAGHDVTVEKINGKWYVKDTASGKPAVYVDPAVTPAADPRGNEGQGGGAVAADDPPLPEGWAAFRGEADNVQVIVYQRVGKAAPTPITIGVFFEDDGKRIRNVTTPGQAGFGGLHWVVTPVGPHALNVTVVCNVLPAQAAPATLVGKAGTADPFGKLILSGYLKTFDAAPACWVWKAAEGDDPSLGWQWTGGDNQEISGRPALWTLPEGEGPDQVPITTAVAKALGEETFPEPSNDYAQEKKRIVLSNITALVGKGAINHFDKELADRLYAWMQEKLFKPADPGQVVPLIADKFLTYHALDMKKVEDSFNAENAAMIAAKRAKDGERSQYGRWTIGGHDFDSPEAWVTLLDSAGNVDPFSAAVTLASGEPWIPVAEEATWCGVALSAGYLVIDRIPFVKAARKAKLVFRRVAQLPGEVKAGRRFTKDEVVAYNAFDNSMEAKVLGAMGRDYPGEAIKASSKHIADYKEAVKSLNVKFVNKRDAGTFNPLTETIELDLRGQHLGKMIDEYLHAWNHAKKTRSGHHQMIYERYLQAKSVGTKPNPYNVELHQLEARAFLQAVDAGKEKMPSFLWAVKEQLRAFAGP